MNNYQYHYSDNNYNGVHVYKVYFMYTDLGVQSLRNFFLLFLEQLYVQNVFM